MLLELLFLPRSFHHLPRSRVFIMLISRILPFFGIPPSLLETFLILFDDGEEGIDEEE